MKKEEEKQFLGGLLIGIIIGAMIGYFTFKIVSVVANTPTQEAQVEHLDKKTIDWSKHPNKSKRAYLENLYLESSKIQ